MIKMTQDMNCMIRTTYRFLRIHLEKLFLSRRKKFSYALAQISHNLTGGQSLCAMKVRTILLLVVMLMMGIGNVWGQDHSGVYYIKNNNNNTFYLCTSTVFYDSNHYANSGEMPYLTTAKSGTIGAMDEAVWRIIKAESGNYYYVVHAVDGKYLTLNDDPSTYSDINGNRLSLHLQYLKDEDKSLFNITKDNSGWYNISPKNKSMWSLNPAGDNYDNRAGTGNKTVNITGVGNNKNVGGLIGLWQNSDAKSKWQFEQVDDKPICDAPTFTNNGTLSISCSTSGATIYYTTDGSTIPTTSTAYDNPLTVTEDIDVVWARATTQNSEPYYWSPLSVYVIPQCATPVISIINGKLNLSCATEGVTIYYTINGTEPTTEYDPNNKPDVTENDIIKAVATKNGYHKSNVASILPSQTVHNTSEMNNMYAHYILASDFVVSSSVGTEAEPFCGVIDGGLNTFSGFDKTLVAYANGATIKNVILDNVTIGENANGYAGAICSEAFGDTRIYNCGVKSGTISGTNAGSIVGKLDGNARVINCYSFATVSGGTWGAGIVGYNSFSSTISDLRTMVMNCMFYGEISSNSKLSPIYGGEKITNVSNLNGYNYYRFNANYSKNNDITDYNCALAAEEDYLTRFEFFRNTLNSNRELAAWYATDDPSKGKGVGNACEMAKWVLAPADKPYPILKAQDYYPSFINYEDAPTLGTIDITINESNTTTGGKDKPNGASINSNYPTTLTVYDKDLTHKHFNYRTVRLPYYNEVGTGNCTHNKVVTGWKITGFSGGTQGHFVKNVIDYSGTTHDEDEYPPYNFADRYCTDKDKYAVSGRVFSQGAYYDVPEGVTGITIEPYWGAAVYLSDPTYDVAYPEGYGDKNVNAVFVSNMGSRYVGGNTASINDDNQTVYTDYDSAFGQVGSSGTVYDNAIVLVGNYHHYWGQNSPSTTKAFTIMSADLNNDCEPDYSFIVQHGTNRQDISAIRFDFINSPGLGMIQKVETDKAIPKHGIWYPKGWFEVTNTTLIQFTQFEYDKGGKPAGSPLILLGGIYDQFVTSRYDNANSTEYIHLGSNVWMKEFCNGTHTSSAQRWTRHVPISVTGGEFESFYLTGTFQPNANSVTDNAECYINGGKFGDMAGAGQEQLKGDVTWLIDHADITNFYGGGINDQKPITGHIYVEINNSQVGLYCGGPKFGNMQKDKKVTTKAKGSTFGNFYGAGYGGTSYFRHMTKDKTGEKDWDTWVGDYTRKYVDGKGISTEYECEFIPYSGGQSGQPDYVGRFYVLYASLSLAKTKNVESTLEDCHITGSFYGGGKLGSVDGNITSTLKNCTVDENVFGAGFSASVEKVNVVPKGAKMKTNPAYNESVGVFTDGIYPDGVPYTWTQAASVSAGHEFDDTNHLIYTTTDLTSLGAVSGSVTLTIDGNTTLTDGKIMSVTKSVYGGGEESGVDGDTEVSITGGTIGTTGKGGAEYGNVYGGGKGKADEKLAGLVKGNTTVNISGTPTILHNVYGGGAYGSVGDFTYDATTGMPTALNTAKTGETNVTITGGTIGTNGDGNGMVFGSSRGEVAKPDADLGRDPNDLLAWVYDTNVTIGTADQGPQINGSIYGSGENGHTFNDAKVDVHSGTIGIEDKNNVVTNNGKRYEGAQYPYRGNVYGGGCGTDTYQDEGPDPKDPSKTKTFTYYNFLAGIVRGNTTVNIDGGHIIHNVYGGGAMGSVGTYSFNAENMPTSCATGTGLCTVTISGGDIGADDMKMTAAERPDDFGHVFGAGRGDVHDSIDYPNVQKTAYYNNTKLTIKGTAFVRGSVYGGSESGHVLNDTHVVIGGTTSSDDPQIGNGDGVNRRYTTAEWEEGKPDVLKATNHWTYIDNGAPYDQFADENGYYTTEYAEGGRQVATDGHTFYGNVFGGGSGYYPYTQGKWLFSAGSVGGKTKVEILSGHILNNVYGGCEMSDVTGSATIEMKGGTVGVPRTNAQINLNPSFGHIFGAGMGDKRIFFNTVTNVASTDVEVSGGRVYGSVHGGGEDGHILGNAKTTISGDVVIGSNEKTELQAIFGFDGNVFGGGQGSPTALTAGTVGGNVELNIMGGTMLGSVYGGGRIASVGTFFRKATDENYGKMQEGDDHGLITVNLTGGTIKQNVYGGGMGIKRGFSAEGVDKELFAISKTVTVNLNLENKVADNAVGCVVKGNIFGCNNVNSSPQETVTVNVGGTQREGASQIAYTASATDAKVKGGNDVTKYDVKGVYGGGNMAAYKPNGGKETTYSTHVNISGCYRTSIGQVYGGGNAASTPATNVTVDGAYEIYELFGGGNGKDQVSYDGTNKEDNPGANVGFYQYDDNITDETATTEKPASDTPEKRSNNYGYGSGEATVNIFGGLLHCVFGGSNTKGNVCKTALTLLEEGTSCAFCVDEVYGGGKSAPMDAEAKLLMQCIPGLKAAYGGAEAADIQGGVTLNITNGTFDQVFGGNNLSGTIRGPIVVNIEETGCKPIIIGELYGGGNQAGYSVYGYDVDNTGNTILKESGSSRWEDPQVNVKSFTSIGNIYGGGLGEDAVMVGDPKVNINVVKGDNASAVIGENATTETIRTGNANAQGGYPVPSHKSDKIGAINNVFGGGNAAKVIGNTQVKIGTDTEVEMVTPDKVQDVDENNQPKVDGDGNPVMVYQKKTVEGADIRGNVYGGGNNAEVTGNAEVIIGKKQE